MSKTDIVSALTAFSQMVHPHGQIVGGAAKVTIDDTNQLTIIANTLGVEPDFAKITKLIQNDEGVCSTILKIYEDWKCSSQSNNEDM